MKHLKTFEAKGTHIFTVVKFESGESVTALYIDDNLFKYGDYYHNKIDNWINGFIDGVRWSGVNIEEREYYCDDPELNETICEYGGSPPKILSSFIK